MSFSECHGHIILDGVNFKEAINAHKNGVDQKIVRARLSELAAHRILYFRDGGDNLGVTLEAKALAPEYGITYLTPAYAIYPQGQYGRMFGRGFSDFEDYKALVKTARDMGADFIKLMLSGIMDYSAYGSLTSPGLPADTVKDLIAYVHDLGLKVMVHVNGSSQIQDVIEAGADTIEHGYYMHPDSLYAIKEKHAVWVPTLSPVWQVLRHSKREEQHILTRILEEQCKKINDAITLGVMVGAGSDAGSGFVPIAAGASMERSLLKECLRKDLLSELDTILCRAATQIFDP